MPVAPALTEMSSTTQLSPGKKLLLSLSFFLFLLIVLDFGIGCVVVWKHQGFPNPDPISANNVVNEHNDPLRTQDPYCHHNLAPKVMRTQDWGGTYTTYTNSLGFKAAETSDVPLTSSKQRILFVGDSFTEGVGVPYEKTFVGRIGSALAARDIEVFDAGVMGYCPKLEFYKVLHLVNDVGFHFDELMVFIDLSDVCDEVNYSSFVPANKLPDDDFTGRYTFVPNSLRWYEHSFIYRNVMQIFKKDPWKRFRVLDNKTGTTFDYWNFKVQWASNPRAFETQGKPGLEACTYYVGQMQKLCAAHGIKMSIAVYPWPGEILLASRPAIPRAHWLEYAQQAHLPIYDFFPFFENGEPASAVIDKYYIHGDVHWNAEGHAVIAKAWLDQYNAAHLKVGATSAQVPDPAVVLARLDQIILPKIEWRDASLSEGVDFLMDRARELEVDGKNPASLGVKITVSKEPAPDGASLSNARLTFSLQHISVSELLRYITEFSSAKAVIDPRGLTILPLSAPIPQGSKLVSFKPDGNTGDIDEALQKTVIPRVEFQNATLHEGIDSVRFNERGTTKFSIIMDPALSETAKISLSMKNAPLKEVLQAIADQAAVTMRVDPYAVVFCPKPNK